MTTKTGWFLLGFVLCFGSQLGAEGHGEYQPLEIRAGQATDLSSVLGPSAEAFLTIRSIDAGGVTLVLKSRFINRIPKVGAFPERADGNFYLASGGRGSLNGSMWSGSVPRSVQITTPRGQRLIPLLQAPDGNRLYLVDQIRAPSEPLLLMVELRAQGGPLY